MNNKDKPLKSDKENSDLSTLDDFIKKKESQNEALKTLIDKMNTKGKNENKQSNSKT